MQPKTFFKLMFLLMILVDYMFLFNLVQYSLHFLSPVFFFILVQFVGKATIENLSVHFCNQTFIFLQCPFFSLGTVLSIRTL